MADFAPVIAFTLSPSVEGGFVNDPDDPGGATNMGITRATLESWRGHPCTVADVQNIPRAEAVAIYTAHYWRPICGDALPAGLDLVLFDFGVNAGLATSARQLQRILLVDQDGLIGPATLRKAQCTGAVLRARIQALGALHVAYYHTRSGFPRFGNGWLARVQRCQATAMVLAIHAAPTAVPATGA